MYSGATSLLFALIGRAKQSSNYDVNLGKPGDNKAGEESNRIVCEQIHLDVAKVGSTRIGDFLSPHQSGRFGD